MQFANQKSSSSKPKVLLVDDNPDYTDALQALLSTENLHCYAVNQSENVLPIANKWRPDLILLDVTMPRLSGYDICRQLKTNPMTRDITIIFITGMSEVGDEEKGLNLGAVDYVTKPFSASVLKARVRNHLDLQSKTKQLKLLARVDRITNVYNRSHFEAMLAEEWNRCVRYARPVSLLLIGVDHFKSFNKAYGQARGDVCLKAIAETLHSGLRRAADRMARFDGDVFVVLLPESDAADALVVAEHLRSRVERRAIAHHHGSEHQAVTVSVGCCTMMPERDHTATGLVTIARDSLRRAKHAGYNRTVLDDRSSFYG